MSRTLLQRRLIDVSDRLKRLRADLAVAEEQCAFFEAEAEDARLRALVSETPLADAEAHEIRRHAGRAGPEPRLAAALDRRPASASRTRSSTGWRTTLATLTPETRR